jgi:hypothetical protein
MVDMFSGRVNSQTFSSLQCFWAGLQASIGHVTGSFGQILRMGQITSKIPFIPEIYDVVYDVQFNFIFAGEGKFVRAN